MSKLRLYFIACGLLLSGATSIAQAQTPTASAAETPPLAARFITTTSYQENGRQIEEQREWRLLREAHRIETHDVTHNTGEVWTRDVNDLQFHELLFHTERQIVEFSPVDLGLLNARRNWETLSLTLNPVVLEMIKPEGETTALGRSAQRYSGTLDGVHYDIVWLTGEQLPAIVVRELPQGIRIKTVLQETYPLARAPWTMQDTAHYRRLEFSDLGDMERDPVVAQIAQRITGGHGHAH